jgi:hypothetical protein
MSGRDERPFGRRFENTPVRDLLLLKGISGRLDIDWVTRSAGLPERCAKVVKDVVQRTRLWTGERLDTAHELTAHFRDGLDAGRSEDELIASFGDVKQAAKLIRCSAKRKRPLVWRAWVRAWQAVGCLLALLLVVVGWSMVRYWTATPTISRNYTAELNAKILAVPESERAWPLYREAILMLGAVGPVPELKDDQGNVREISPVDAEWPQMVAYAERAKPALELIVRGAERAELGSPYRAHVEPELSKAIAVFGGGSGALSSAPAEPVTNPTLIAVLLPEVTPLRRVAMLMCEVVAVEAARTGNAVKYEQSVSGVLGLAAQLMRRGTMIEQLVGHAILAMACGSIEGVVREHPALLDEGAMGRISHRLGSLDVSLRLSTERMTMPDIVQRVYSDDGRGDGVITRRGLNDLSLELGVAPAMPTIAGRRETLDQWDRWFDRLEAAAREPGWKRAVDDLSNEVDAMTKRSAFTMRHPLLSVLMPSMTRAVGSARESGMRRDATCVGLALEIHKRRHGTYPATLSELVPALLPEVPKDCYDGAPLRYRVKDGRPELYSVWRDGKDDGGVFERPAPTVEAPDMRLWGW